MITARLLPHKFKKIGWIILIPATVSGLLLTWGQFDVSWAHARVFALLSDESFSHYQRFTFIHTDVTNTVVGILFITGAILVMFSRERQEDEFIARTRLTSLLWSVLVSYCLLLFAFIFVYGSAFLTIMVYNMFTIMIIFIVRFNYIMYKARKLLRYEK